MVVGRFRQRSDTLLDRRLCLNDWCYDVDAKLTMFEDDVMLMMFDVMFVVVDVVDATMMMFDATLMMFDAMFVVVVDAVGKCTLFDWNYR